MSVPASTALSAATVVPLYFLWLLFLAQCPVFPRALWSPLALMQFSLPGTSSLSPANSYLSSKTQLRYHFWESLPRLIHLGQILPVWSWSLRYRLLITLASVQEVIMTFPFYMCTSH